MDEFRNDWFTSAPDWLVWLAKFDTNFDGDNYNEDFCLVKLKDCTSLFDGDARMGAEFVHFADLADGSVIAIWHNLSSQGSVMDLPIVFISSEWDRNRVIARNGRDLLSLLAAGVSLRYGLRSDALEPDNEYFVNGWKRLRDDVKRELDIDPIDDVDTYDQKLLEEYPDFGPQLDAWADERFG